ncbi:acyl-coenzyme A thioesterase 13-like [Phoenix dactylifera]|uniref:Acyl-coenzyme A thioesterase 13 n=1 Tax=Phoenix dactylifera TaxID=42345 RepID=A0A8B9AM24_PHODC|nr:acyl-coenzyme A thioesterase 13-like [Phoenix dactylifera]
MDLEAVRSSLEASGGDTDALPPRFFDEFVLHGLRIDLVEPGRVLCSMPVPPRLTSGGSFLHGGVTATLVDLIGSAVFYSIGLPTCGVSLEITVSYMDAAFIKEEIEIEAKLLHAGKAVGVSSVEFRKKGTGKIIAQARHTKYLAVSSKL